MKLTLSLVSLAIIVVVSFFSWLFYLAIYQDSQIATVSLTILALLVVVISQQVLEIVRQKIAKQSEQQTFLANAKENLSIMSAIQGVQNRQSGELLRQNARLLSAGNTNGEQPEDIGFQEYMSGLEEENDWE